MSVKTNIRQCPLLRPFAVSHLTTTSVDVVGLTIAVPGCDATGYGEIAADPGYAQDGAAIAAEGAGLAADLASDPADPELRDLRRIEDRLDAAAETVSSAARMLVEMAVLDRAARLDGGPVWRLLRLPEPGTVQLLATVPIGDPIPAYGPVKIKLGGPADVDVLRRLVDVSGPVVLDVNRGWNRDDWTRLRGLVQRVTPAVLEDPVSDVPGLLTEVRAALPNTAVVLDEGIDGPDDVERAATTAGGANVKVMKLGGLFPARRALQHLTHRCATRMLGCYLEPPRAIAYAAQLNGLADWTDLDGHFWLSADHPTVSKYKLDSSVPGVPSLAK